jgi:hypothetical protein
LEIPKIAREATMDQIDFILWLQSFRSPLLDAFFTVVNATAEDNLITALAVIIFWCVASQTASIRVNLRPESQRREGK